MMDQDKSKQQLIEELVELRQREAQWRASETKYRRLHQSMMDAFVSVDIDGRILEFNEVYGKMLGYEPEELLKLCYMDVTPEKWHSYEADIVQKQILSRGYSVIYEKEYRRKDGTVFPIELRTCLITDDKDQPSAMWAIVRDITERKQAEEALKKAHGELEQKVNERTAELREANARLQREVEERRRVEQDLSVFRRFTEAASQGFGMADLDGRATYVNQTMCRLLGEEKPEDVIGKMSSDYYPEEFLERRENEIIPAVLQHGYWQGEFPLRSTHGKIIPTIQHVFLIRDEIGQPCQFAVTILDITERKQAQEALCQNNNELRTIYNGIVEGLLITDIESKHFLRVNPTLCRMLGYAEKELLAASIKDIHPPEEVPEDLQRFQAASEGRVSINEDRPVLRKDGSIFYADITGHPIFYNGRPCLLALFRDITTRKQAENALQQAHDELQAIYDQMVDGIIVVDAEKENPIRANSAYCRMLGYSEKEVYTVSPERVHPPEVLPAVWKHLETVKQGLVARIDNLPFLRKDGDVVYADVVSSPIRYNERPCWISFFHDVTDRRQAEEALKKDHRTLKHLLQASDHERQTIAYEIHDELAQQLAGAIMQFQAYAHLKETQPNLAIKAYEAGMTLLQQGHFETRRLIAGVRPPILDESGIVAAIGHLVQEQARGTKQKIDFHSMVDFDRLAPTLENSIYRIAQEALTNACQYSKSKKVRVSFLQRKDRVRIEIRDWGVGFDTKKVRENHFGLEGIRQRARLLGGKCKIQSAMGEGTRIAVELPVVERETE